MALVVMDLGSVDDAVAAAEVVAVAEADLAVALVVAGEVAAVLLTHKA